MQKIKFILLFAPLILLGANCRQAGKPAGNQIIAAPVASPVVNYAGELIDVPKLVNQSVERIEAVLGRATEKKTLEKKKPDAPDSYAMFKTAAHPNGLTVHFRNKKAAIFNLVLTGSVNSPREGLQKFFGINVGDAKPVEKTQFLEKWSGEFGGVKFANVYAYKERVENNDYKLLHAEVAP